MGFVGTSPRDRDAVRGGLDLLRKADAEDAVPEGRRGLRLVHAERELDLADPGRGALLGGLAVLGCGLGGVVRENDVVVLDREVHVLGCAAGEEHLQTDGVVVREDVHGREAARGAALEVLPDAVELVGVDVEQVVQETPGGHVEQRVHAILSFPPHSGPWLLTHDLLHGPCQSVTDQTAHDSVPFCHRNDKSWRFWDKMSLILSIL